MQRQLRAIAKAEEERQERLQQQSQLQLQAPEQQKQQQKEQPTSPHQLLIQQRAAQQRARGAQARQARIVRARLSRVHQGLLEENRRAYDGMYPLHFLLRNPRATPRMLRMLHGVHREAHRCWANKYSGTNNLVHR